MAHTIRPVVNLNGSSKEDLLDKSMEIHRELKQLAQLMRGSIPHPRDYQTGGNYAADRKEAIRRINLVDELAEAYYLDAWTLNEEAGS